MFVHAATAEMSALTQQLLLSRGAAYQNVLNESNWKRSPALLQFDVPTRPDAPTDSWLIVPWDIADPRALEVWLSRYSEELGCLPDNVVIITSLGRVDPTWLHHLAQIHRVEIAAIAVATLSVVGSAKLRAALDPLFHEEIAASLEHINPLTRISGVGDPRDPRVFIERLRRDTPRTHVTRWVIYLNVAIYVLMLSATGFDLFGGFSPRALAQWGANVGALTLGQGEVWRLLSCTFVHANVIHIGMNMWALHALGEMVERLYGSSVFAAIYLLAALGGSLCSLMFTLNASPWVPSVGASGAVFGVMGALLGFALSRRGTMPRQLFRGLTRSALIFIGLNLAIGLSIEAIDNGAHIGGLLTGLGAGVLLSRDLPPAPQRGARAVGVRVMVVLATLLGLWTQL